MIKDSNNEIVRYSIRYQKDLHKKIKQFCLDNEGIDMKDVFIRGAILYMEKCKYEKSRFFR